VLLAPASTPADVIDILNKALARAKQDQAFVGKLAVQGMIATESSPAHARAYLKTERGNWEPLVQSIGLKLTP
jgi:tripartite-type tricarboxylate transporter receptor subunit TctC